MQDDISIKFQQVSEIFNKKFKSLTVRQHNQEYLDQLYEKLKQWKSDTNEQIDYIINEKLKEINLNYRQYCQEIDDEYERIDEQIRDKNSPLDTNDQIENFNVYCQSNTVEKRIHLKTSFFTEDQIAEKIQLNYVQKRDLSRGANIVLLRSLIKEGIESDHHSRTSSGRTSPIPISTDKKTPTRQSPKEVDPILGAIVKPLTGPLKEDSFRRRTTSTDNDNLSNSSTRLYTGRHDITIPVLIDKNREFSSATERMTEYSIDSLLVPSDKKQQSLNVSHDNDDHETLVQAYKVLIEKESDYQQLSSSDQEDEVNSANVFNLKQFNQINYSTIMLRKCETEHNCISSSTNRNELLIYNSKLKILLILQHEYDHQCRHRFYVQWSDNISPNISDITYCQNNDQFLISTLDSCHIYFFNRDSLSITDLGKLSDDLQLRRIHCYQQTIYCILGNNYLLEFQLNEQYSNIKFIQKIKLFNPKNHSLHTAYHLLDVTCDKSCVIIVYANEHDEIRLQSIHRQSLEFHSDFVLDKKQHIQDIYIRIESTNSDGKFIYLNGLQQHLKSIDLVKRDNRKITSTMRQQAKPTNVCLLHDDRLVILYEQPYFLSVHDRNNRRE